MTLLDVGVWLAAIWGGHGQHKKVATWFQDEPGPLFLCRVTHMSLLRLLSNPALMGEDVVSRRVAWQLMDKLRSDERVAWADEPTQLEPVWRAISSRNDHSHKLWTDDYLAAFAQAAGISIATLDRGFAKRYPSITTITLG